MRIGMLSWESLNAIEVGGIAPHVTELSEALARRGHEVHIFTRRGDYGYYDQINGVHYQRVDSDRSGEFLHQMDSMCDALYHRFGEVQEQVGNFDIVHGHDWLPMLALTRIKQDFSLPFLLTMHSTEWGRNGRSFVSESSQKTSRQEHLGCYISQKRGKGWDAGRVREKYGIDPTAPLVLFFGWMSIQNGPNMLMEAVSLVQKNRSDVHFVFTGKEHMRSECEQLVRELGVSDACRFLGHMPTADRDDLINACDLICIPSEDKPYGIVVLEGWDIRKPEAKTGEVNIVNNLDDGLAASVQPDSIAWCISSLLADQSEKAKIDRAAGSKIETGFCLDHMTGKEAEEVCLEVRMSGRYGYESHEKSYREWIGCKNASLVVVTSRLMQDELMRIYSVPKERTRIIPNGIIVGKIRRSVDAGKIKEKHGINPNAPLVLFCGRMFTQKGPDLLVEAVPLVLKERPDACFVFVGKGRLKQECELRARELGVADACRFLGFTPTDDKDDLINACDLMCIPSRNEPFGIVVLEAWDACKPVVATEAVSIVNDLEDGLVASVQSDSIARCINRLLADPKEMAKMGRAGCSRIEAEFSWDHIAEMTEMAYAEVMRSGH